MSPTRRRAAHPGPRRPKDPDDVPEIPRHQSVHLTRAGHGDVPQIASIPGRYHGQPSGEEVTHSAAVAPLRWFQAVLG